MNQENNNGLGEFVEERNTPDAQTFLIYKRGQIPEALSGLSSFHGYRPLGVSEPIKNGDKIVWLNFPDLFSVIHSLVGPEQKRALRSEVRKSVWAVEHWPEMPIFIAKEAMPRAVAAAHAIEYGFGNAVYRQLIATHNIPVVSNLMAQKHLVVYRKYPNDQFAGIEFSYIKASTGLVAFCSRQNVVNQQLLVKEIGASIGMRISETAGGLPPANIGPKENKIVKTKCSLTISSYPITMP